MKKGLLIWNVVLTVLLVTILVNACTFTPPDNSALIEQINQNREYIQENRGLIKANREAVAGVSGSLEEWSNKLQPALEEYIQEYVDWYITNK